MFLGRRSLVDTAFEGDRERVERWLPSRGPACPTPACRVKRAGHEVEALQRRSVVREVPAGADRAPVAGVERLDRVGQAQYAADLDVVVEERDELRPGVVPQPDDRRVALSPALGELVERGAAASALTAV